MKSQTQTLVLAVFATLALSAVAPSRHDGVTMQAQMPRTVLERTDKIGGLPGACPPAGCIK
jgi:hypothetical protein